MSKAFGIYLGNSTCSVALNDNEEVKIIADNSGFHVTPTVVTILDEGFDIGLSAKQGISRNGPRTIMNVLKAISSKDESEFTCNGPTCKPDWSDDNEVSYTITTEEGDNKKIMPVAILKMLFKEIMSITDQCGSDIQKKVTLCLPAWVSRKAINITRDAARQAGFKIVSTVLQPTSACLAYNLLKDRNFNCLAVTLHLGETSNVGGLLDISGGVCTVRDITTSDMRPGVTITNILVDLLAKEFMQKFRSDPLESKRSRQRLYNAADGAKHVLSRVQFAKVNVECLGDGIDFQTEVRRFRFEPSIASTLEKLLQPTLEMLNRNGVVNNQVTKVILTGGTCMIPRLQKLVSDTFGSAEVLCSIPSDEVLACGAAVEAVHVTYSHGGENTNGTVTPITNGTTEEEKPSKKKKKKNKNGGGETVKEPVRSHLPERLSTLSVNIYAKVEGEESVCVLPRLTPPQLKNSVSLPVSKDSTTTGITIYESLAPTNGEDLNEDSILATIKVPVHKDSKNISMSCMLKPEGCLFFNVVDSCSKFSKKFVISSDSDNKSS